MGEGGGGEGEGENGNEVNHGDCDGSGSWSWYGTMGTNMGINGLECEVGGSGGGVVRPGAMVAGPDWGGHLLRGRKRLLFERVRYRCESCAVHVCAVYA